MTWPCDAFNKWDAILFITPLPGVAAADADALSLSLPILFFLTPLYLSLHFSLSSLLMMLLPIFLLGFFFDSHQSHSLTLLRSSAFLSLPDSSPIWSLYPHTLWHSFFLFLSIIITDFGIHINIYNFLSWKKIYKHKNSKYNWYILIILN